MRRRERIGVVLLIGGPILLLAACARAPEPGVDAGASADPSSTREAEPSATEEPVARPSPAAGPPQSAGSEPAAPTAIDLEVLSSDPAAALPGALVRHGRYEVRQSMHEGGFVVAMTEELAIHELAGRFVGRIASQSDATPMPPSFLVFTTDDQRRIERVIWRGLAGTSAVEHEHDRVSLQRSEGELAIERQKRLTTSTQRVTILDAAWVLGDAVALAYLPLWSQASTAWPTKAEWISVQLQLEAKPRRVRAKQRRKETIEVGGREIDAWHYETKDGAAPPVDVWVDEQGLVVRRLEASEDEAGSRWETIYVPLAGDPLAR